VINKSDFERSWHAIDHSYSNDSYQGYKTMVKFERSFGKGVNVDCRGLVIGIGSQSEMVMLSDRRSFREYNNAREGHQVTSKYQYAFVMTY